MKKRLLSAALALAMVLTLLPMSAFAAVSYGTPSDKLPSNASDYTDSAGNPKKFYDVSGTNNITQTVTLYQGSGEAYGRTYGKWYWLDNKTNADTYTYYEVQSGIIVGNGTSGAWYKDLADFTLTAADGKKSLRSTSFTILGNTAVSMVSDTWTSNSLNVVFSDAGQSGCGTLTVPSSITSLTVNTTNSKSGAKGTVNGFSSINRSNYATAAPGNSNVTLNATNVTIDSIGLTGRSNTVTLNNCTVTNGVTMNGTTTTDAANTKTAYNGQRFSATGGTIGGAMAITGDGSSVTLTSVGATTNTLKVVGHGGSVNVAGSTVMGTITVNSRATSAAPTVNANIPTVTVTGGSVAGINTTGEAGSGSSNFNLTRSSSNSIIVSDAITTNKGTVTVSNATVEAVEVKEGTVSLTGPVNATDKLTLGALGKTTLTMSGSGFNLEGITTANGENLSMTWPNTGRNNYYGKLELGSYNKGQITGGTFKTGNFFDGNTRSWFNLTNLAFQAKVNNKIALYDKTELARAIEDAGDSAQTKGTVNAMCQGDTYTLTLKYGSGDMAIIGHEGVMPTILPTLLNSKPITSWMWTDETSHEVIKDFPAGTTQEIPAADIELTANDVSLDVTVISKITGGKADPVNGGHIRVDVNGTTVALSGAVLEELGGVTTINLDLTTDAVNSDGKVVVLEDVPVQFYPSNKSIKFSDFWAGSNGARTEGGKLILANGTTYTVTGSGLAVSATNLKLVEAGADGYPIEVNVGGDMSGWRAEAKEELIKKLNGAGAGLKIDVSCIAWSQAINAAQATITSTQTVESWRDNARNTVWSRGFKSPESSKNTLVNGYMIAPHNGSYANASSTDTDKVTITSKFSTVYIVPYLQVNITKYDPTAGTLTATLVPSYRVAVSGSTYDATEAYVAQTGRALSNLTGEMGDGVTVKFALGTKFDTQYMHQDGKYVYKGTSNAWTLTHAGTTGLGSIVIDGVDGLISLDQQQTNAKFDGAKYDSLQAAVDDTVREETGGAAPVYSTVTIDSKFTGSCAFDMTGVARTIKVVAKGTQAVSCTSNYVDAPQINGATYTFQLKRDVAASKGNITVASATGGSASVSANPAQVGSKVTVTLSAQAGYSPSGVSVKDSSGKAVSVSGSGSSYSFTMPSGSVTVTPSFTKTQVATNPTVHVSGTTGGSAYTSAGNNQVAPGTTVTVTTTPGTNQRTMGVSVTGATAVRTGANTFQFTVPSGYNTVTVTPRFDANNGTLFQDVWSYEYYSNPVRWAVERGITNGTSTYTFGSENVCTREDMVTFLWRAAGSPTVSSSVRNPFWDVQAGSYYYNAVLWAVSKGITNGVSANQFGVGQYVTRGQAVTFLYRYEGSPAAGANSGFYDVNSREYYAKAVSWANSKGVTNGTSATTFGPNEYCKRAQIVTFLYRDITGNRA